MKTPRNAPQMRMLYHQVKFGLCGGMSYEQIAKALGIGKSYATVLACRLYKKYNVHDRVNFLLKVNSALHV